MIELDEHTRVFAFGFGIGPEDTFDIMGMCYRQEPEEGPAALENWSFKWRIRLHVDDKVFDSDDPKTWYGKTYPADTPVEELSKMFREDWQNINKVAETVANTFKICDCDSTEALEQITKYRCAHKMHINDPNKETES